MEKFENPDKIKKSFEIKYQNDDDDEIFIVHEEEDDQDSLFVTGPSSLTQSEQPKSETLNPFKDTLANSERLPELPNKLDVLINDNYISELSHSQHQENISKRKKRG